MTKDTQKYCAECKAGEIYDEPAVALIRHKNVDTFKHAPPITKYVCERHWSMLVTDLGEDDVTLVRELGSTSSRPVPVQRQQHKEHHHYTLAYYIEGRPREGRLLTNSEHRVFDAYDKTLEEITRKGGWITLTDNRQELVIAEAVIR